MSDALSGLRGPTSSPITSVSTGSSAARRSNSRAAANRISGFGLDMASTSRSGAMPAAASAASRATITANASSQISRSRSSRP